MLLYTKANKLSKLEESLTKIGNKIKGENYEKISKVLVLLATALVAGYEVTKLSDGSLALTRIVK